ncbi:MAG: hydantoinase/oxoprolinase family protein, partial [Candidatus Eiseniibacteriota bacterium]
MPTDDADRERPRPPRRSGAAGGDDGDDGMELAAATAIGIDTGGTFTDLVAWVGGRLRVRKVLSTPRDPGEAVLRALGGAIDGSPHVVHGTTVATNALLERRGARLALVTTRGFEDVIEIGRQARPDPYALEPRRVEPLVPRTRRLGIPAPLEPGADGPLPDAAELAALRAALVEAGAEAVAVCLLFSYADAAAERAVEAALRDGPWELSLSSRVLPVFREYERTSTTAANAYVAPAMSRYLRGLAARAPRPRWRVMASNGGSLDLDTAAHLPAACLLSGPAGGVLGARRVAADLGITRFLTLDMGGTSTDVCLVEESIPTTGQAMVAGLPVAFPSVDIHTVGAGGGSIIRLDDAGVLRVGPQSAGADPGPIAYGRGERPTVTDANLLLGRIPAATFATLGALETVTGVTSPGDPSARRRDDPSHAASAADIAGRVRAAFAALAAPLGVSPERAAAAALAAVEAAMARALRVISTRRGRDPRGHALVCFGGAGPLHGAALAAALGIETVVVPPCPGVLSAIGLALADARRDYVRALLREVDAALDRAQLEALAAPLVAAARRDAAASGQPPPRTAVHLDLRYRGQSHELQVPLEDDSIGRFHREHERRFGHADRRRVLELVHVRVEAVTPGAELPAVALRDAATRPGAAPPSSAAPPS